VLLDLLMPDVDGYEVLATLRDDPATADLPIVLVTAKGTHKEAVVTEALNLRRTPGLTVREATGWMGAGLDALLGVSTPATS
jgi:CheY-like chemotaxis protein